MTDLTEFEANVFAAMLLMPPTLLPEGTGASKPTMDQADAVAERCDVSLEVALRGLIGLSHWRSALVVSKDGMIKWVVPSPQFDGYIEADRMAHPRSMAWMLLETSGPSEDGIVLPVSAWVKGGTLANEEVRLQPWVSHNGF